MAKVMFIVMMSAVGAYLPYLGFGPASLEFWVILVAVAAAYIFGAISNG